MYDAEAAQQLEATAAQEKAQVQRCKEKVDDLASRLAGAKPVSPYLMPQRAVLAMRVPSHASSPTACYPLSSCMYKSRTLLRGYVAKLGVDYLLVKSIHFFTALLCKVTNHHPCICSIMIQVKLLAFYKEGQCGIVGVNFQFQDPERGFDRGKVKGVVAKLVHLQDPTTTTALEVAAGGKLYQVCLMYS